MTWGLALLVALGVGGGIAWARQRRTHRRVSAHWLTQQRQGERVPFEGVSVDWAVRKFTEPA